MLDIIQEENGKFVLINGPRRIDLLFEQVSWIYEGDFYDIDEFDIEKAKEFYKGKELRNYLQYKLINMCLPKPGSFFGLSLTELIKQEENKLAELEMLAILKGEKLLYISTPKATNLFLDRIIKKQNNPLFNKPKIGQII